MTPERWRQVTEVFHAARVHDLATRAQYLDQACGDDRALRDEVDAMLAAQANAAQFGETPVNLSTGRIRRLESGAMVGSYRIDRFIDAGSMGDVYRAHDMTLHRDVALKILPDVFAADPDRLARFAREAQVLASLNHPNIAVIYGLQQGAAVVDGADPASSGATVHALVLELVEGATLADRITQGPVPLDEAMRIGTQIGKALEAAHEHRIIHRDLKPSNIGLRRDGTVKVLDFGVAKIGAGDGAGPHAALSTVTGVALGTAAYMSPEQARGSEVDKRSDIWAFGCVLYEMLTGRRAFDGESVADTIAQVMSREPDLQRLPPRTPPAIRTLLQGCLQRDPRERIGDIAGALFVLKEAAALSGSEPAVVPFEAPPPGPPRRAPLTRRIASVSAVVLLVGVGLGGGVWLATRAPRVPATPVSRFAIALPTALPYENYIDRNLAMSSDGTRLVYRSQQGLVVRSRDRLDATLLPSGLDPFFSPDGEWIGYTADRGPYKVSVTGGTPVFLTETRPGAIGSWGANGIVLADVNGLFRLSSEGGTPEKLRMADLESTEQASFPEPLPGGEIVVLTVLPTRRANTYVSGAANAAGARIEAVDLRTGARKTLVRGGAAARYVPTGHLIYAAQGMLYAVAFDVDRVEVRGDPIPVASDVGSGDFAVSAEGSLVYGMGADERLNRTLVWRDRRGSEESLEAPARPYVYPRLSPDGTRVAVVMLTERADRDIWIWDLHRSVLESFTMDPSDNPVVVWSRDGRRLAFSSARFGGVVNVFWQMADGSGTPERLVESARSQHPVRFAADGRLIVSEAGQTQSIVALSLDGTRRLTPIIRGLVADVSPDGRWIAYDSNESGQFEIYVRPYPDAERGRWVISRGGGRQPLWSRDGRELFYRDFTGAVMAVPVSLTATFVPGPPVKLLDGDGYAGGGSAGSAYTYDLSRDGLRFLMMKEGNAGASALVVVQNWTEELKRLVPVN
jgi:serine/threonine-protein kinase